MFKNSYKLLFMVILMFSTLLSINANNWFSAWMGLEINLLAFIPLMANPQNTILNEACLKYFIIQAIASTFLFFSIVMNNMKYDISSYNNIINLMIMSSLLLKSGTAPFHFWFPNVMEGLTWINSIILMTWQKITPLMLISYLLLSNIWIYIVIILSIFIGSLGGLNQTSLRKIMAFSSINHLGWMFSALLFNNNIWLLYFIMYTFLSITLIYIFHMFNMFHINQLFNLFIYNNILKYCIFINFLSLGGLPPFMGFMPKWLVIQNLSINKNLFLMVMITILTLITLFFYIRLTYSAFMLNYYENNWTIKLNYFNMNIIILLTFFSLSGLFLINSLYSFM